MRTEPIAAAGKAATPKSTRRVTFPSVLTFTGLWHVQCTIWARYCQALIMMNLQGFIEHFTYLGIFLLLLLGSLGAPIPEEMPIVAAAILSHEGVVRWWQALPICFLGVLSGDLVLYWVGRHWGERVLKWRVVRLVLNPRREQWLKAAYRRHAVKTTVTARHVMGLRAAAFLTAGIAHVPFWKFLATDAAAALVGVPVVFGLAYFFTDQIQSVMGGVHRAERWIGLGVLILLVAVFGINAWRWNRRLDEESLGLGRSPRS